MHTRSLAGLSLLVMAFAFAALSCNAGLDYVLNFDVAPSWSGTDVDVAYTLYNNGRLSMSAAMIKIQVDVNGSSAYRTVQETPGVDLASYATTSGTLTFTFPVTVTSATATVVSAGWDQDSTWD
jgi:hypothetical protein